MALIGPMKYLTIGGSTYEIQGQEITSSAITSALGYTPYNGSTNPNGYISSYTDEKLKTTAVTSGTTYYPIVGSNSTTAANKNYDSTGFSYAGTNGTANGTNGNALLTLGNNTASTSANWKKGTLRLYGTSSSYTDIISAVTTTARTITLPNATGTVALTSDIPDVSGKIDTAGTGLSKSGTTLNHYNSVAAQTTQAVYPIKIDAQGHISEYGSSVTIPSITLNGSSTKSPSFYAPATAGGSGQYLKSNGSGAPSWTNFPTIPTVPTNVSAFTNDAGYITSDVNVTSTASSGLTNYIVGTSIAPTTTGTLFKHTSASIYISPDSENNGYTQLNLGNSTAITSAGGKEGRIRLFGRGAGGIILYAPTINGTTFYEATFPNKTGTVALTSDIPTIPSAGSSASAVGTSSSGGSATTWSRSDHIHNITSSTIGSAGGVTGIKINGTTYSPTSGTVDLGTISSVAAQIIRW